MAKNCPPMKRWWTMVNKKGFVNPTKPFDIIDKFLKYPG